MPIFIRPACMSIIAAIGLLTATPSPAVGVEYDTIIRNGHIIDGTGSPWYAADIAVKDGRIAAIGDLADAHARQVIDAHGLVVAPGFIDMLGQSEITLLVDPHVPSKIFQGITTEITGEGESVAPLDAEMIKQRQAAYAHYRITPDWRTFEQYFTRLQKQGMGINVGTYVGATSVREMVIGYKNRAPTPDELKQMQMLVADAMKQGALGLSTALEYTPGALRRNRRVDRPGEGCRTPWRHLRDPHAQRGRCRDGRAGRNLPDRPRGGYSGGDFPSQGHGQSQGQDGTGDRAHRRGSCKRRRRGGGHLRLYRVAE